MPIFKLVSLAAEVSYCGSGEVFCLSGMQVACYSSLPLQRYCMNAIAPSIANSLIPMAPTAGQKTGAAPRSARPAGRSQAGGMLAGRPDAGQFSNTNTRGDLVQLRAAVAGNNKFAKFTEAVELPGAMVTDPQGLIASQMPFAALVEALAAEQIALAVPGAAGREAQNVNPGAQIATIAAVKGKPDLAALLSAAGGQGGQARAQMMPPKQGAAQATLGQPGPQTQLASQTGQAALGQSAAVTSSVEAQGEQAETSSTAAQTIPGLAGAEPAQQVGVHPNATVAATPAQVGLPSGTGQAAGSGTDVPAGQVRVTPATGAERPEPNSTSWTSRVTPSHLVAEVARPELPATAPTAAAHPVPVVLRASGPARPNATNPGQGGRPAQALQEVAPDVSGALSAEVSMETQANTRSGAAAGNANIRQTKSATVNRLAGQGALDAGPKDIAIVGEIESLATGSDAGEARLAGVTDLDAGHVPVAGVVESASRTEQSVASQIDSPPFAEPADVRLTRQIADAVSPSIARAGKRVTVRLNPPELGRVRITFQADGQELRAVVEVESARTLAELQREAPALMARLAEGGVNLRRMDFTLNDQSSGNDNSSANWQLAYGDASGRESYAGSSEAESGEPSALEAETPESTYGSPALETVADDSINLWV